MPKKPSIKTRSMRKAKTLRRLPKRRTLINKSTVNMGLGFPKKLIATLKYVDNFEVSNSSGSLSNYLFSCNSINDPNLTGSGHRPMFYTQYMNLYRHYHVIGSKITVKFLPQNPNIVISTQSVAVGVYLNDDTTSTHTNYFNAGENSLGKINYVVPSADYPLSIVKKWSARKTFGASVMANNDLQGTAGFDPLEQTYFNIWLQSCNFSAAFVMPVQVQIEYIVVFDELRDITGS